MKPAESAKVIKNRINVFLRCSFPMKTIDSNVKNNITPNDGNITIEANMEWIGMAMFLITGIEKMAIVSVSR